MPNRDDDEAEINRLLKRAAELATSHSFQSKQFVLAAWEQFLACNPRMRDKIEEETMREEFAKARRQGKLALA